jgi:predicted N-acetyltransferase YhbS
MAVAPEDQGKKLCSLLMRAVSAVADEHGLPCYLETSGLRNAQIYERFGYEKVERVTGARPEEETRRARVRRFLRHGATARET